MRHLMQRLMQRLTQRLVQHPKNQRGFSLIELMVAIAIAGLLVKMGAPFFSDYVGNSRLREGGNLLLAETLIAQSEAVKRTTRIRVSTAGSTVQVLDMTVPATPVVLRDRTLSAGVTAPTATLDFGSEGRPVPFGTSGSINISSGTVSCSIDMRCPGLRVDAGGAIRLCGNYLSSCP